MLRLEYKDYTLDFKFDAGTSRGVLRRHKVAVIKIWDSENRDNYGLGEAAPLKNLSPESMDEVLVELDNVKRKIEDLPLPANEEEVFYASHQLVSADFPSIRMALETALMDLMNGGQRVIFDNLFSQGKSSIPINGLIWMGEPDFMKEQIHNKLEEGYECIKMKIGSIDFKKELDLIKILRDASSDLIIRVDANGAFKPDNALSKLEALAEYNVHSIEQPISAGQIDEMRKLVENTPVPIALDEELIGVTDIASKLKLLHHINPQFIILKPTLVGGFSSTLEWISIAKKAGIGWWITSALESNITLNAIGQFTANFDDLMHQGLGTGQLYQNNFHSPLELKGPYLSYNIDTEWQSIF